MAGRIQVVPEGLLNLLGLKTTGKNPSVFPDFVQGVVELGERYELSRLEVVHQARSVEGGSASLNNVWVAIPAGELWRVHAFSMSIGGEAAPANQVWAPYIASTSSGLTSEVRANYVFLGANETFTGIPADRFVKAHELQRPKLLPPGWSFGFSMQGGTIVGPIAAELQALVSIIPV